MDAILHFLGLCPDSFSHPDVMNFFVICYGEIQTMFMFLKSKFK
jgi:hypothetical protein